MDSHLSINYYDKDMILCILTHCSFTGVIQYYDKDMIIWNLSPSSLTSLFIIVICRLLQKYVGNYFDKLFKAMLFSERENWFVLAYNYSFWLLSNNHVSFFFFR